MILNQPLFNISNKCCYYAKKLVAKHAKEDCGCDLSIVGVRKAEGGPDHQHTKIALVIMMVRLMNIDLYSGIKILIKRTMKITMGLYIVSAIQNMG